MLETWVAPTAGRIAVSWELPERVQYALESQTLAAELQMENSLGRSLDSDGCRVGHRVVPVRTADRSGSPRHRAGGRKARRRDVERVWERLAPIAAPRNSRPSA